MDSNVKQTLVDLGLNTQQINNLSSVGEKTLLEIINSKKDILSVLSLCDSNKQFKYIYNYYKENNYDNRIIEILKNQYEKLGKLEYTTSLRQSYNIMNNTTYVEEFPEYSAGFYYAPPETLNWLNEHIVGKFDSLSTYKLYLSDPIPFYNSAAYFFSNFNMITTDIINALQKARSVGSKPWYNSSGNEQEKAPIYKIYSMDYDKNTAFSDTFDFVNFVDIFLKTEGFKTYFKYKDTYSEYVDKGYSYNLLFLIDLVNNHSKIVNKQEEVNYLISKSDIIENYKKDIEALYKNKPELVHTYIENYIEANRVEFKPSDYYNPWKSICTVYTIEQYLDLDKVFETIGQCFYIIDLIKHCEDFEIDKNEIIQFYTNNFKKFESSISMINDTYIVYLCYKIPDLLNASNLERLYHIFNGPKASNIKYMMNNNNIFTNMEAFVEILHEYLDDKNMQKYMDSLKNYSSSLSDDDQITISKTTIPLFILLKTALNMSNSDILKYYKLLLEKYGYTQFYRYAENFDTMNINISEVRNYTYKLLKELNDKDLCKYLNGLDAYDAFKKYINNFIDTLNNNSNFKVIEYDDETTFIDVLGIPEIKGEHIISINDNNLTYDIKFKVTLDNINFNKNIVTNNKNEFNTNLLEFIDVLSNADNNKLNYIADELNTTVK